MKNLLFVLFGLFAFTAVEAQEKVQLKEPDPFLTQEGVAFMTELLLERASDHTIRVPYSLYKFGSDYELRFDDYLMEYIIDDTSVTIKKIVYNDIFIGTVYSSQSKNLRMKKLAARVLHKNLLSSFAGEVINKTSATQELLALIHFREKLKE